MGLISGSELSELLLNFGQTQQNAQGSPLMFHHPHSAHEKPQHHHPRPAALYGADKASFLMLVADVWPGFLLSLIPGRWLE